MKLDWLCQRVSIVADTIKLFMISTHGCDYQDFFKTQQTRYWEDTQNLQNFTDCRCVGNICFWNCDACCDIFRHSVAKVTSFHPFSNNCCLILIRVMGGSGTSFCLKNLNTVLLFNKVIGIYYNTLMRNLRLVLNIVFWGFFKLATVPSHPRVGQRAPDVHLCLL